MKKLLTITMILILNAHAQAADGPFGFEIGSDLSSYENCSKGENLGFYVCTSAKKEHPGMETYVVQYFEGIGICWVKGIGKDISDNGLGYSTKGTADKLKNQVAKVYGEPTDLFDFLSYGSIWDDLDDWMMGLAQQERYYTYAWSTEDGYQKVKGIDQIMISAKATSSNKGYVVIEFQGENGELCDRAESAEGESAF